MQGIFWKLAFFTGIGFTCLGQAPVEPNPAVRQYLLETQSELQLSDAQVEKITPILTNSFTVQRNVLKKYGIDLENHQSGEKLGLRKARKLSRELQGVRKKTLVELKIHLSKDQLTAFKKIQKKRQSAVRKRVREGRNK